MNLYEGEGFSEGDGIFLGSLNAAFLNAYQERTLTVRDGILLRPDRTYWIVLSTSPDNYAAYVATTGDPSESAGGQPDWTIEDVGGSFTTGGWAPIGSAIPLVTIRAAAYLHDLPHTPDTWGYVDESGPSIGLLNPTLDDPTRAGLYREGDWWELRVTPGRRYRVEVEFTAPDAGLQPWEVGGGITIREGCCTGRSDLWDHMSDDGRAFIEFSRGDRDQTYYLAVEPESSGEIDPDDPDPNARFVPNEYFGPYTITLTDIGHVRQMVSNGAAQRITGAGTGLGALVGDPAIDTPTPYLWAANSFTTGSNTTGYQLEFVGARLLGFVHPIYEGRPDRSLVKAALHRDDSGSPGAKLFDFERIQRINEAYSALGHDRFWAPARTILAP